MLCSLRSHLIVSMHPILYPKEIDTVTEIRSAMEKLVCIFKTHSSNRSVVAHSHVTPVSAPHFAHNCTLCWLQVTPFLICCKVRKVSREVVGGKSPPLTAQTAFIETWTPQGDKRVQLFCAVCEVFAMNTRWVASWNPLQGGQNTWTF